MAFESDVSGIFLFLSHDGPGRPQAVWGPRLGGSMVQGCEMQGHKRSEKGTTAQGGGVLG